MGIGMMSRMVPPLTVPSPGTPIGTFPVGTTVRMMVNGVGREFLIVHQGKPSAMYDGSCDGTWLLMKDIYENRPWHSSNNNDYEKSTINDYLNGTWLNLLDARVRSAVKSVKIPYRYGAGDSNTPVNSGGNGLSVRVFLLSGYEVGFSEDDSPYVPHDGDKLAYFDGGTGSFANQKRKASFGGAGASWWTRSPQCRRGNGSFFALEVAINGDWYNATCSKQTGIRPALILPKTASVDDSGNVTG